jgi:hypothetical protein
MDAISSRDSILPATKDNIYTNKKKKTIEILTAIQNSISRDLDVSCSLPFVIADTFAAYRNEGHLFNEYQNSSNIATKKSSVIQ